MKERDREREGKKGGRKTGVGDMETLLQGPSGGDTKESETHCKVFVRGSSNSFQNHWLRKDHSVAQKGCDEGANLKMSQF